VQQRLRTGRQLQRRQELVLDVRRIATGQPLRHDVGVDVDTTEYRGLALAEQVGAREGEGRARENHRQQHRAKSERHRDARLQTEPTRPQARESRAKLAQPCSL